MSRRFRELGLDDSLAFDDREFMTRFVSVDCSKDKSLTVQAPAQDLDINRIVGRVQKGQPVLTSVGEPFYGDVSEFGGLQDAIMKVQEAEHLFMQIPADVREKFENDPVKFVEFLGDPANTDEAIRLGLAVPKPKPEVPEPPVATPGAPGEPK